MSKSSEYIIEFYRIGNLVKVTAIDTVTAIEAVVMCPTTVSQKDMKKLAVQKLEYLLRKQ